MSSSSSSWEPLPLHRHLSTVGIGPVFACPPSHYQLPPSSTLMGEGHTADGKIDDVEEQPQQDERAGTSTSKSSSASNKKVIKTWEIVGDIKSTPQDFVVREIGWCPPPNYSSAQDNSEQSCGDRSYMNKYIKRKRWRRGIAGLTESDTFTHDDDGDDECREHVVSLATMDEKEPHAKVAEDDQQVDGENCTSDDNVQIAKKMKIASFDNVATKTLPIASLSPPSPSHQVDAPSTLSTSNVDTTQSPPDEVLRQILIECFDSEEMVPGTAPDYADSIMKQLSSLQNEAYEQLKSTSTNTAGHGDEESSDETKTLYKETIGDDTNAVWISTSNLFKHDTTKGSWKLLHQTLRQVYPLLKTENASRPPCSKEDKTASNDDENDDKKNSKNAWVCALIDDCFFPLVPFLVHPSEDLFQLYMFRSLGPVTSATNEDCSRSNQSNNRKKNRWKKGKKDNQLNNQDRAKKAGESNDGKVLLRLRPEIPRTDRRNIHQIITGKNTRKNDFETSTRNDVSIENASKPTTSAIVVQWSRMALQNTQKKRKRQVRGGSITGDNSNSTAHDSPSDIEALFCTLKKEHIEHQVALQSLMRALKCRPGDIGLAGIKDMKAVTYQFCTLRNVDMKRAKRPIMGDTKVSLSNFVPVKNFLLDRGRLIGNQFEITLRNLRQVERLQGDDGPSCWKERAVTVRRTHLDVMVNRVAKHGFINYYGEQRVGDAGHKEYVGARSFEVGRALLQSNFSLAVDLIMEGRSSNVYNPTQEEVNTRQTWMSTKDARVTLKEFPKSRNVMVRERDLMRGLLRYGNALEALRTVPHNTKTFWVHSYQSLVWNKVATERVRRFGVQPIEGDLYLQDNESDTESDTVQVLTGNANIINISQVVLPLPGYSVRYPANEIGDLYREILAADGVQLSVKNDEEEATVKGSYRRLIQHANNLKWYIVASDEEIDDNSSSERDPVVDAARFTFELESGCYATMMLRELMLTTMVRGGGKC